MLNNQPWTPAPAAASAGSAVTSVAGRTGAVVLTSADVGLQNEGADGWVPSADTWTYASASTFTVSRDIITEIARGDRIKLTQTTVKYFYMIAAVFAAGTTTVTVTGGSDFTLANAAITLPNLSKKATPALFPQWFVWAPTLTGFSANPAGAIYLFCINGRSVTLTIVQDTDGTSNSVDFTISIPVTASGTWKWMGVILGRDNGGIYNGVGFIRILAYATSMVLYKDPAETPWTNTGGKSARLGNITYRF